MFNFTCSYSSYDDHFHGEISTQNFWLFSLFHAVSPCNRKFTAFLFFAEGRNMGFFSLPAIYMFIT